METQYGLKFLIVDAERIGGFSGYDKSVAECHIANCGFIIVYAERPSEPIDNEYDLEEIYSIIKG